MSYSSKFQHRYLDFRYVVGTLKMHLYCLVKPSCPIHHNLFSSIEVLVARFHYVLSWEASGCETLSLFPLADYVKTHT